MNKVLEKRINRLEKFLSRKNESVEDPVAEAIYNASNDIQQIVNDLCMALAYSNIADYREVDNALSLCEDSFSEDAYRRCFLFLKIESKNNSNISYYVI